MSSKKKTNKHRTIGHTAPAAVTGITEAEAVLYRFLYKVLPEKSSIAEFQATARKWMEPERRKNFRSYFISSPFGAERSDAFKTYAKLGSSIYIGSRCNRANLLLSTLKENTTALDNFLKLSRSLQVSLLEIITSFDHIEHSQEYTILTTSTDKLHDLGKKLDAPMSGLILNAEIVSDLLRFAIECPKEFDTELVFLKLSNFGYSVSARFSWLMPVAENTELYTSLLSDVFGNRDEFEAFHSTLIMSTKENAVTWH